MLRLFLVLILSVSFTAKAESPSAVLIIPNSAGTQFWQMVSSIAQEAAHDLGISLEVIEASSDRFAQKEALNQLLNRHTLPDYIIFRPFYGSAINAIKLMEKHKINYVTLEGTYVELQRQLLSNSELKNKYWLGQIHYDNLTASELLTKALIDISLEKSPNTPVSITALGGDFDAVSKRREMSLLRVADQSNKVTINQRDFFSLGCR